jgi:hypothetical protein
VNNGGAGGGAMVHQRLLDNGAEVRVCALRVTCGVSHLAGQGCRGEQNSVRYGLPSVFNCNILRRYMEPGQGQPSFVSCCP